jgi:hypothetical protein
MSANKHRPHIQVLPEDDANRQLANGFILEFDTRQIQTLSVAGGWKNVLQDFKSSHAGGLEKYPERLIVLLIDFDGRDDRRDEVRGDIPSHLKDRVFILGAWTEPEDLKRANLGSYENIGKALAQDCRRDTNTTWGHNLLRHNADEIARFCERARSILCS